MRFTGHLLVSPLLLFLYPALGNGVFVAMAASLLIDIDHVTLLIREKAFDRSSIRSIAESIYQRPAGRAFKGIIYPFHTVETNSALIVLAFVSPLFACISLGFIFHILSDIIHHVRNRLPVLRWLYIVEFLRVNA